jgi:hypothetical protein
LPSLRGPRLDNAGELEELRGGAPNTSTVYLQVAEKERRVRYVQAQSQDEAASQHNFSKPSRTDKLGAGLGAGARLH